MQDTKEVRLLYSDYASQQPGQPTSKKYKSLDPLSFIHPFCQHILPSYFHKSRRYGLHASATSNKYKEVLDQAIKRNTHTIRTVMQVIRQMANEQPYACTACGSTDYEIIPIARDKEWIYQYISIATTRPPLTKTYQI